MEKKKVALIQIDACYLPEIDDYCRKVKEKTGSIKRHVVGSLLMEAIRMDTAKVNNNKE